ncbi:cyclic AMP receptor-like protein A isoform X2 [Hydra vulgaris]|uniref:Cyclic AMP receptor-like protein A isoform X2 n=1 Tax=Hydra vulgaris TaxID=6087 RepID=A0ABM4BEF2_HYDVU
MIDVNYTLDCPLWPDAPHQCSTVMIIQRFVSTVSLLGCLFIIVVICLFRAYRIFIQRLILFLSISAAFQCISYVISDLYTNNFVCQFQAFIMQYFSWSTLLWVVVMTMNIILSIYQVSASKFEKYFHLVAWILPFFWASLPFKGNNYGQAGVWCWIKRDATALRFGTWYIPKFIIIFLLVLVFSFILLRVVRQNKQWKGTHNTTDAKENVLLIKEVKQLAAYPLIYAILSLPTLIYRIEDAVHPNQLPKYYLLILSVLISPAIGAVNALAFAFYGDIRNKLSFSQLKFATLSCFRSSTNSNVIHNYEVDDEANIINDEYSS